MVKNVAKHIFRLVWAYKLLWFGLILTSAGFFSVLGLGSVYTLICEWTPSEMVDCVIKTTWLDWIDLSERQVHDLRGAYLQKGGRGTYTIILESADSDVTMNNYGSTSIREPKEEIIAHINNFVKSPTLSKLQERYTDTYKATILVV